MEIRLCRYELRNETKPETVVESADTIYQPINYIMHNLLKYYIQLLG